MVPLLRASCRGECHYSEDAVDVEGFLSNMESESAFFTLDDDDNEGVCLAPCCAHHTEHDLRDVLCL